MAKAGMRKATATRGARSQTNVADVEQAATVRPPNTRHKEPLFGTPSTETDPGEILLQEIQRTAGHIEWLREQLLHSDPDRFVQSLWLRGRASGWVAPGEFDTRNWSAAGALWVEIYQKERAHLASICRTALAAGIEERRVRIAERMAGTISDAIRGMLFDLGLDPEDDRVRSVVYKWLMQAQGQVVSERRAIAG